MKFRRFLLNIIAICIIAMFAVSANAQETILYTVVPEQSNIDIMITGQGSVIIGENEYFETTENQVIQNTVKEITVIADEGWTLKSIFFNGANITYSGFNNTYIVGEIKKDNNLAATFEEIVSKDNPKTGESNDISAHIIVLTVSLIILMFIIRKKNSV